MDIKYLQLIQKIASQVPEDADPPKFSIEDIANLIVLIQDWALIIVVIIATAMIIYAGYMYMLSQGDPGKIKQAQGTMTWAILGLVFILIARMVMSIVLDIVTK